jgi:pimeloyl-ACP methyl ester carboxylesterase
MKPFLSLSLLCLIIPTFAFAQQRPDSPLASRRSFPTTDEREETVVAPNGKKLYVHVHTPNTDGKFPAVVLMPGGIAPGTGFDRPMSPLPATFLARYGLVIVHFDPEGRGRSEGEENMGGKAHQDDLKAVVEFTKKLPEVDANNIGVASTSFGIVAASGCLARYPELGVKFLFDLEGPSNAIVRREPRRRGLGDAYWEERHADKFVSQLKCRYFRVQAEIDHAQGSDLTIAFDLLEAARKGGVPWFRCNDNPPNIAFDRTKRDAYKWLPGRAHAHAEQIVAWWLELMDMPPVK